MGPPISWKNILLGMPNMMAVNLFCTCVECVNDTNWQIYRISNFKNSIL